MSTQTTAFNPATDNPSDPAGTLLPPTASHAAKSLSLFISGKPLLSDRTLTLYTRIIREGMDHQSYTSADWNAALGLDAENPLGDVVLRTLESLVSDNDAVLESSKVLETQLREKFGAEGRGLHEYTSNVESALPENLVKTLHWIATRRNGIVHGEGDGFQDTQERARFVLRAAWGWDWLAKNNRKKTKSRGPIIAGAIFVVISSVAFVLFGMLTYSPFHSNHSNNFSNVLVFGGYILLAIGGFILGLEATRKA